MKVPYVGLALLVGLWVTVLSVVVDAQAKAVVCQITLTAAQVDALHAEFGDKVDVTEKSQALVNEGLLRFERKLEEKQLLALKALFDDPTTRPQVLKLLDDVKVKKAKDKK